MKFRNINIWRKLLADYNFKKETNLKFNKSIGYKILHKQKLLMITKFYMGYNNLQCYIANTKVYYRDCVTNSDA